MSYPLVDVPMLILRACMKATFSNDVNAHKICLSDDNKQMPLRGECIQRYPEQPFFCGSSTAMAFRR